MCPPSRHYTEEELQDIARRRYNRESIESIATIYGTKRSTLVDLIKRHRLVRRPIFARRPYQCRTPTLPLGREWCRHCKDRLARKDRDLCGKCSGIPAIKALFPEEPRHHSIPDRTTKIPKQIPRRTSARPGSPEKIEVLAARAAAGQLLWNPWDALMDEDERRVG